MNGSPTSKSGCDVVVVGEYYCDLIFHNLDARPELGKEVLAQAFDMVPGGSFNPAMSLARLGVRAFWQCGLGTDPYSGFIRSEAAREGISDALFTQVDRPLRRITSVFSMQADRGFMTYIDGPDPAIDADKVLALAPKIVLFQGMQSLLDNLAAATALRAAGTIVLADCGHIEKTMDDPQIAAALAAIDVFLPNADEATQLTGESDLRKAVERLLQVVPSAVIKNGANGAVGFHDGEHVQLPTIKVDVVDLTGAGDCYNAGFVFGLINGYAFQDAMMLGGLNGSLSTTGLGGRAVPTAAQLLDALKTFTK